MTFGRSGKMPTNADVALWFIARHKGITEVELSEKMFGVRDQPKIHQEVDFLESLGLVRRDHTTRPLTLHAIIEK